MTKLGFGGSCHWCTEAVFQSIIGVYQVDQGWISSEEELDLSEAVVVSYDPESISMSTLIEIHLHSHSCTSSHSMRNKYRSAIYVYSDEQSEEAVNALASFQKDFEKPVITQVLRFKSFKLNKEEYLNYYYNDPEKPFCENVINPKLAALRQRFAKHLTIRDTISN